MWKLNLSINVKSMSQYNFSNYDAEWLIKQTLRPDDILSQSRRDQIKFLVFNSLILCYILSQVQDYILLSDNFRPWKIIVTENTPLVAWFYEQVLNHLHIDMKVLTAYLKADERKKVVNNFTDSASSLLILIVMYAVSAQRLNLNSCCTQVLMTSSAVNVAAEVQAWGRVLWVSYSFISVWRCV